MISSRSARGLLFRVDVNTCSTPARWCSNRMPPAFELAYAARVIRFESAIAAARDSTCPPNSSSACTS